VSERAVMSVLNLVQRKAGSMVWKWVVPKGKDMVVLKETDTVVPKVY